MQTSNLKDDIGNMCKGVSFPFVDRFSEIPTQPKDRRMRLLEAFAYIFTYEIFIITQSANILYRSSLSYAKREHKVQL